MNYKVKKDCIEIKIYKPLYSTFVYIRDTYLKIAKEKNIPLVVTIPQGTYTITYDKFMDNAKRMEKVFNFPDRPMVLYGNYLKDDNKKNTQATLLGNY